MDNPLAPRSPPTGEARLARVPSHLAGRRLDQVLAVLFDDLSRSRLAQWIDDGRITCDGAPCRRRDKVDGGEEIRLIMVPEARQECLPQDIPLDLVYEDDELLVLNKPANLVVHPAAGNPDGTLQNALLHHCPALDQLPRAGIVHRLDKDTTGLLVVAKSLRAHKSLVDQLARRTLKREYRALVTGVLIAGGTVEAPIGRHPTQRERMAVVPGGRVAVTHYRVLARYRAHSLLAVHLQTGRTHQIRVHMTHIRHPLVGDRTYGGRTLIPRGADPELLDALRAFPRQALHAVALGLIHPGSGEPIAWKIRMAADMDALLGALRRDVEVHEEAAAADDEEEDWDDDDLD